MHVCICQGATDEATAIQIMINLLIVGSEKDPVWNKTTTSTRLGGMRQDTANLKLLSTW